MFGGKGARIFQFNYCTIKSSKEEAAPTADKNFNSTIVRLKEGL